MKQRIITSLVAVAVFLAVMVGYYTVALNIAVSIMICIAVNELFKATGNFKHKAMYYVSTVFAASMPFTVMLKNAFLFTAILAAYVFIMLAISMKLHQTVKFHETCTMLLVSVLFPLCFLCLLLTRYVEPVYGIFYIFITCFIAWGGDIFAYFSGRFFGKHKLAPVISPKKTVEGMIGGVFGSVAFTAIIAVGFTYIMQWLAMPVKVSYAVLLPAAAVFSLVSVFGDLSCSLIKRQYGIKDYGTLFPGHGGVMDRFDSVLMIAPFVYFLMNLYPVVVPA